MKYTNEIIIDLPIEKFIELFDNADNMKHWQPGLISFEHLSGTPGEVGAKSVLKYQMGKRLIEMEETITKKNLPHEFDGTYKTKGVYNIIKNRFSSIDNCQTKWFSENEFQFSGFMKLIGLLMPGAFKKQSQVYLDNFKKFAEKK